ncbi:MAG: type II secretion system protein [Candidatus Omnitrophica bacterium]|nr:type II secretion system protein [Candidatus Omnitrophota bacterium]
MKKGITLAEVLLGMVILTFALVAVLALFANCIISNESNRNLTIALSHVQLVMEEIRGEVEDKTTLLSLRDKIDEGVVWWWDEDYFPTGLQRLPNETIVTCCHNHDPVSPAWCCPPSGSCPDEDPLRIRVTSSWDDRGGRTRNISLESLITVP